MGSTWGTNDAGHANHYAMQVLRRGCVWMCLGNQAGRVSSPTTVPWLRMAARAHWKVQR